MVKNRIHATCAFSIHLPKSTKSALALDVTNLQIKKVNYFLNFSNLIMTGESDIPKYCTKRVHAFWVGVAWCSGSGSSRVGVRWRFGENGGVLLIGKSRVCMCCACA
jgi:hypothetical protein